MAQGRRALDLLVALLLVGSASSRALGALPPANVLGSFSLEVVEPNLGCRWVGQVVVVQQQGSDFNGTASINLVEGNSPPCLETLTGPIEGQVNGNDIIFGAAFGGIGMATFEGEVSADDQSASGTWSSGGLNGTWDAIRLANRGAPALGPWALAGLAVTLASLGVGGLRRRGTKSAA